MALPCTYCRRLGMGAVIYGSVLRSIVARKCDVAERWPPRTKAESEASEARVKSLSFRDYRGTEKDLISHATWHPSTQDNRESDGAWRGFCSASALGPSAKVAQAPPTVCKGPWAMAPSLVDRHLQSSHGGVFDFLGALKIEKTPQSHPMASGRVFTGNTDESPPP
jgi:hypothetical protein